jgi:hypothetical protein
MCSSRARRSSGRMRPISALVLAARASVQSWSILASVCAGIWVRYRRNAIWSIQERPYSHTVTIHKSNLPIPIGFFDNWLQLCPNPQVAEDYSVHLRETDLKTGVPFEAKMVRTWSSPLSRELEQHLHCKLRAYRLRAGNGSNYRPAIWKRSTTWSANFIGSAAAGYSTPFPAAAQRETEKYNEPTNDGKLGKSPWR